jgi:hypothetical protein
MKGFILNMVNMLEAYKTAIKSLHWDSNSLSQHELCDKIADSIADFQDVVAEVEQSLSGNLPLNELKPTKYKVKNLKQFVLDVIDVTTRFYNRLKRRGDDYIGMRSECESFLAQMQRYKYLVDFTLKEDFKKGFERLIKEQKEMTEETYEVNPNEFAMALNEAIMRVLNKR